MDTNREISLQFATGKQFLSFVRNLSQNNQAANSLNDTLDDSTYNELAAETLEASGIGAHLHAAADLSGEWVSEFGQSLANGDAEEVLILFWYFTKNFALFLALMNNHKSNLLEKL